MANPFDGLVGKCKALARGGFFFIFYFFGGGDTHTHTEQCSYCQHRNAGEMFKLKPMIWFSLVSHLQVVPKL